MKTPHSRQLWSLAHGRTLELGQRSILMGILNITPDSFSDGGRFKNLTDVITTANSMIDEGADFLDIGGESTRPGAEPVSEQDELERILPVIKELAANSNCLISVDTYRANTARAAIAAGAHAVNDVWGLQKDAEMASVVADAGAGIVIMHTGRSRKTLADVIDDQKMFLNQSLDIAARSGIHKDAIVLDPGIGFAKGLEENIALLNRFEELHQFGYPLLIGTSRKRFLGTITGHEETSDRDIATAATSVVARLHGASIFRVHDVATNRDALKVADALSNAEWNQNV